MYFFVDAFSSIKEKNGLISKGMCVLLFDVFNRCSLVQLKKQLGLIGNGMSNIYFWEKLTFSELRFSRKENFRKCISFEEQKETTYIQGNVYFGIIVSGCHLSTNLSLRFLLICFAREIKSFYLSSFGN